MSVQYVTLADFELTLGRKRLLTIADPDKTGAPDGAYLDRFAADASSIAQGYIAAWRDAFDATTAPPALKRAVVSIAVFLMASALDKLTEDMKVNYDEALRFLRDVAKGLVALGDVVMPSNSPGMMAVSAPPSEWDRNIGRRLF